MPRATHVISHVPRRDEALAAQISQLSELRRIGISDETGGGSDTSHSAALHVRVVSPEWLEACISQRTLVDTQAFQLT